MVRIPGGTFMMGSHDGDDDEKPEHKVTLGPYAMDKTEVTVAAYAACVKAGACTEPDGYQSTGSKQLCTYGASGKEQHPVNCVDWTQAEKFCRWKGGRLPTEAEWEHAARGSDGRKYPWGNTEPNGRLANGCGRDCVALAKRVLNQDWTAAAWADDGWEATSPVGTFPAGASPFGLLDMAGNVWEWTSDWYGAYSSSNQVDPKGASSGATRVCRGGSWFNSSAAFLRAANRVRNDPSSRVADVGFRCARGSS
jgi:formylglycine-generating enzyme required for sulfatase activity